MINDIVTEDVCRTCGTVSHNGQYYSGHGYNCVPCGKNLTEMFSPKKVEVEQPLDITDSASMPVNLQPDLVKEFYKDQSSGA